jgi:hypothetical protein
MFTQFEEFSGVRNMLAHFVMRRFPDGEDAYVFATLNMNDFESVLGRVPDKDEAMVAVVDGSGLRNAVGVFDKINSWLTTQVREATKRWGPRPGEAR